MMIFKEFDGISQNNIREIDNMIFIEFELWNLWDFLYFAERKLWRETERAIDVFPTTLRTIHKHSTKYPPTSFQWIYIIIHILELLHKLCCWVGLQPYLWTSDKQTRLPKGATWLITLKAPKVNSASKEIASLLRIEGRCRQKLFNMMKYLQFMVLWWYDINEFWHGLNWGAWKLLNLCSNVQ